MAQKRGSISEETDPLFIIFFPEKERFFSGLRLPICRFLTALRQFFVRLVIGFYIIRIISCIGYGGLDILHIRSVGYKRDLGYFLFEINIHLLYAIFTFHEL